MAAIAVAGVCFVVVPLRCGFPPVTLHGWFGTMFSTFLAVDRPYNLLPSLHAALGLILFDLYFQRTRGLLRVAVSVWFLLVAFSPLLTHQHHFADIVAGFALAGYCFYTFGAAVPFQTCRDELVPDPANKIRRSRRWRESRSSQVNPNFTIALLYLGGAAVLFAVALRDPKHWAILGWVATALALVSAAYFGGGPQIFRKRSDGTVPLCSIFALAPCILGQFLSLLYYRRKLPACVRITHATLMGRRPNKREAAELIESGVTAVLDLCAELPELPALRQLNYLCVPILDLTTPTLDQLELAARFISAEAERGQVYIHCKIGYSRSAAVMAASLLFSRRAKTVSEAVAIIWQKRPVTVNSVRTLKALEEFRRRFCIRSETVAGAIATANACFDG